MVSLCGENTRMRKVLQTEAEGEGETGDQGFPLKKYVGACFPIGPPPSKSLQPVKIAPLAGDQEFNT